MGNSMGGEKRNAKVMKVDGTTFRVKPPATAGKVTNEHPGHHLLDSGEVKRLGIRARPLDPDRQLKPGKIYFLVELPRFPDRRAGPPRRAWSGNLHVSAKDRLEGLKLSRRSVSDLSVSNSRPAPLESAEIVAVEEEEGRPVAETRRVRVRLPKAEVAKLMEESMDAAEAAEKIVELFLKRENAAAQVAAPPPAAAVRIGGRQQKEKRTRFVLMPEEIVT